MDWIRFLIVVAAASVATSFTDWLFMGVLFHDRYKAAPELWRSDAAASEPRYILISQLVAVISCAAFTGLCVLVSFTALPQALGVAVLVWLAGPVVVLAQFVLWTRLHPLIGLSHALGWLTRFLITALLVAWLLSRHTM